MGSLIVRYIKSVSLGFVKRIHFQTPYVYLTFLGWMISPIGPMSNPSLERIYYCSFWVPLTCPTFFMSAPSILIPHSSSECFPRVPTKPISSLIIIELLWTLPNRFLNILFWYSWTPFRYTQFVCSSLICRNREGHHSCVLVMRSFWSFRRIFPNSFLSSDSSGDNFLACLLNLIFLPFLDYWALVIFLISSCFEFPFKNLFFSFTICPFCPAGLPNLHSFP